MKNDYANLNEKSIKIINIAQENLKIETGKNIILLAYETNEKDGGNSK